jgi:hypothetical protein
VSDSALTSVDDVIVTVNPAGANHLTAQYFNDAGNGTHFGTLVLTRVDPTINFNWAASPVAG